MTDPSFRADLQEFTAAHGATKARLRALLNVGRLLSIVLIIVFVGFLAALYGKVTTMYAPDQFQEPLREEARKLLPRLEPELRTLVAETVPVYSELALQKFHEALPAIQENSRREYEALRANLTTHAERRINDAWLRVSRTHRDRLARAFPRMSSPDEADALGMKWLETIEGDFEQVLAYFHQRYTEDLGELGATLDQFYPNRFEHMTEDELLRQFAHLWLMKMDHAVLLGEGSNHDG